MTLSQFLVFLHDKMLSQSLRSTIDAIFVNIPVDYIIAAAQKNIKVNNVQDLGSDFGLVGAETSPINPDANKLNIKKLGPNWVNLSQDYSDQSFVLSFVQTNVKSKTQQKSSTRSDSL